MPRWVSDMIQDPKRVSKIGRAVGQGNCVHGGAVEIAVQCDLRFWRATSSATGLASIQCNRPTSGATTGPVVRCRNPNRIRWLWPAVRPREKLKNTHRRWPAVHPAGRRSGRTGSTPRQSLPPLRDPDCSWYSSHGLAFWPKDRFVNCQIAVHSSVDAEGLRPRFGWRRSSRGDAADRPAISGSHEPEPCGRRRGIAPPAP